jgi:cholesterol transport system auxiliary component
MNALSKVVLATALAALLPACSILGGSKEPLAILDPLPASAPVDAPAVKWSLLVLRPIATAALDTERIVVRPAPGALQVYKGAAWSDTAPDLVHTALVRAFEDSGKILSVARPGGVVRGEFQLATDLRAFESVYEGASPFAVIELQARLVRVTDGHAIAARTFRVREPAQGTDVDSVRAAFAQALGKLDGEVVAWTLREGNAAGGG